jgi:hypothetical protein
MRERDARRAVGGRDALGYVRSVSNYVTPRGLPHAELAGLFVMHPAA